MLRFEQASSEEKIPLGQRTVFFSDVLFSANIYEAIYEALQGFV